MAGTLAAVTSFLLASKIGIGGSVIGAAASYVVSAVATKIYQNVLTASGEKLQSASSSGSGITKDAENGDADGGTPPNGRQPDRRSGRARYGDGRDRR